MSDKSIDDDDLRKLLLSALDGDADDAEIARLNETLRNNVASRRSAARFLCDDSFLAEEIGTIEQAVAFLKRPLESPAENDGVAGIDTNYQPSSTEPTIIGSPTARASFSPKLRWGLRSSLQLVNNHGLAVAAAALFVAAVLGWHYWTMMSKFDRLYSLAALPDPVEHESLRKSARFAATQAGMATVAQVTGLSDCRWPSGELALKFGDQLAPGQQVKMSQGLMQLTFNSGAKVVLEGPADFVATKPTEATLSQGRIAAAVPHFARGYTILTPTSEVVDLGTEFGVAVDDAGSSEVHVFNGDVVARPRSKGVSDGELIHAREDQAVQFGSELKDPRRIAIDRKKFIRRLTPELPPDKLPPLPITDNLVLWLAADVIPGADIDAPVPTWPDILIGDNRFPDDAWQFDTRLCPTWVRDADGRPAVRFDGWSTFMATSPMATGDHQTAFVVFAPSPASFASESHGGMLLKYGLEAPSLELTLLPDRSPRGWVWARMDDGSNGDTAIVKGRPVEPHLPCAVAYSYDMENNRAELLTNGKSQGVAAAPKRLEQFAKKYLGSHAQPWYEAYFLGNIYEVIVYDSALNASDRQRVFQYLSARYGFSLGD
jgi:hypothetical protein